MHRKTSSDEFGYVGAHVSLKADQEPAIVELQSAVIQQREGGLTTPVISPVGDSASNGSVEIAVKRIRGLVKVLRSDLQARWRIPYTLGYSSGPRASSRGMRR